MAAMFVGVALIIRVASSDHKPVADDSGGSNGYGSGYGTKSDEMIDAANVRPCDVG